MLSDNSQLDDIVKDIVDDSVVSVDSDIVLGLEHQTTTATTTCLDESAVPDGIHTEGSISDINALTGERCNVDTVIESLSLPIYGYEEESRI
jgi:hypothetical protein